MGLLFNFSPLSSYDQIYLLPDETHFKFKGLTCLQEATMLTACYLQNTSRIPASCRISALSLPCHGGLPHHHFQGCEKEVLYNTCPGPPFFPSSVLEPHAEVSGDAVKLLCIPPETPGLGCQLPRGCSIAPLCQRLGSRSHGQKWDSELQLKESSYWEKSSSGAGLNNTRLLEQRVPNGCIGD